MGRELFLHARQPTLAYPLVKGAASGGFAALNSGVPVSPMGRQQKVGLTGEVLIHTDPPTVARLTTRP